MSSMKRGCCVLFDQVHVVMPPRLNIDIMYGVDEALRLNRHANLKWHAVAGGFVALLIRF